MAQHATRSSNKRRRTSSTVQDSPSARKPRKTARRGKISKKADSQDVGTEISDGCDRATSENTEKIIQWRGQEELIEKVVSALLDKKKEISCLRGINPVAPTSGNLLHYMHELQTGRRTALKLRQSTCETVAGQLSQLQLFRTASPFERRCTVLEWHPTNPSVLVIGSKGGEILVWDINTVNNDTLLPGTGPAGSLQAMKFQPRDHSRLMTSSIDGTVSVHNLETKQKQVFMDTMNSHDDWYCSLDIHHTTSLVTVGDNHGNITLKTLNGETAFTGRLHRQKTTHVEYNRREEWLLATASVDQTVQLWDIRMLESRKSALAVLKHDKPINSVYFSLCSGTKLLTTDQHSQLRVYDSTTFDMLQQIPHPHRHFRHITPHKAQWHPLCDVIVVGRYPDEKFPGYSPGELRTVDMFDAESGKLVCQLHDPQNKGIISLNKFSHTGEYLASTMGVNVLIWSQNHDIEEKHNKLMSALVTSGIPTPGNRRTPGTSNRRGTQAKPKLTKEKRTNEKTTQSKLKAKVSKAKR